MSSYAGTKRKAMSSVSKGGAITIRNPMYVPVKRTFKRRSYTTRNNELKFIDYEYDGAVVATVAGSESDPATALALNSIAQGDGDSNRDGRQAFVKSIYLRGQIEWAAATSANTLTPTPFVRVLVLQDVQTNGAQFNAEDCLVDPTDADLDVCAVRNLKFPKRFKILMDQTFACPVRTVVFDADSIEQAATTTPWEFYKKLNFSTTYTDTTAVVGSIQDKSLHVVAIRANNGAAQLRYISRVRFQD